MSDVAGSAGAQFRVGSVISRGIAVFFRNIVAFAITSIVAFLPAVILSVLLVGSAAMGQPMGGGAVILMLIVMLAFFVCYFWVLGALTYGVIMDLRGNRPSVGAMLSGSLRALVPVVLTGLVVGGAVGVGFIFFIIPGLFLLCMFWVAVPAAVVEQQGVGAALTRSRQLTAGRRWSVLGVIVLWAIIAMVVQMIVAMIFGEGMGPGAAEQPGLLGSIVGAVVSMLVGGIAAAVNAVGYHDLRVEKEGGDAASMARTMA